MIILHNQTIFNKKNNFVKKNKSIFPPDQELLPKSKFYTIAFSPNHTTTKVKNNAYFRFK